MEACGLRAPSMKSGVGNPFVRLVLCDDFGNPLQGAEWMESSIIQGMFGQRGGLDPTKTIHRLQSIDTLALLIYVTHVHTRTH